MDGGLLAGTMGIVSVGGPARDGTEGTGKPLLAKATCLTLLTALAAE